MNLVLWSHVLHHYALLHAECVNDVKERVLAISAELRIALQVGGGGDMCSSDALMVCPDAPAWFSLCNCQPVLVRA